MARVELHLNVKHNRESTDGKSHVEKPGKRKGAAPKSSAEFLCPIGLKIIGDDAKSGTSTVPEEHEAKIESSTDSETREAKTSSSLPANKKAAAKKAFLNPLSSWESAKLPLEQWFPEDVSNYIKTCGKAACWDGYAKMLLADEVDGTTLLSYGDMKALREDFPHIKRPHARIISMRIRTYLQRNEREDGKQSQ
uniref:SAM domain-containing protein n=1 Tax=Lotharella oceanica TaxID=641309 RepID=A0A7S2TY98_9EUKA|mmetsp:Transcript_35340/g.65466  ORF Transcript_35340/g.65466 Transcript_35340/m.65466 type:complete len:194 (+) Transcript_35340:460-1041(+)